MKKLLLLLSIVCGGSFLVEAITPTVHLPKKQKEERARLRRADEARVDRFRTQHGPRIREAMHHGLKSAEVAHTK